MSASAATAAAEGQIPSDAFVLHEAVQTAGPVQDDGTVLIHVIRPTVGRGRGSHLYEADMLEQNAGVFADWKMYVNHQSPEARKKAGGLPRDVQDLGGRIVEAEWDASVPADSSKGFGAGAVVAKVRPTPFIRELIENDPEIIEASINAQATGVRQVERDGKKVWLVEGIQPRGSVDWVTEAGAGGRVVSLLESVWEEMATEATLLETMSDDQFAAHLREHRPQLFESLQESGGGGSNGNEGGGMDGAITPEALQEALQNDESRNALVEALGPALEPLVQRAAEERLPALLEGQIEDAQERARTEATADARRDLRLRDMRDSAHKMIEATTLPEGWKAEVKADFDLVENRPTDRLDQIDDVDGEGNVTKSAEAKLREAVTERLGHFRTLLAEARPTRVNGQGPSRTESGGEGGGSEGGDGSEGGEGGKGGKKKESEPVPGVTNVVEGFMQSIGVDANEAYSLRG